MFNQGQIPGFTKEFPFSYALPADFTIATIIPTDVTGWRFPVVAGKRYLVRVVSTYFTGDALCGAKLGIGFTGAGAGVFRGSFHGSVSSAVTPGELSIPIISAASNLLTLGAGASGNHFLAEFVVNCTVSGELNLRWCSEIDLTAATIDAGSTLIVTPLN